MPLSKDQIEKMKAQRAKWDQRIAKAQGKLKQSERKHMHHQNFLIGAFVHDRLDHNASLSFSDWADLKRQIDKFLTRDYDRVAFGLPMKEGKK